jgi:molecular chaperone HscB
MYMKCPHCDQETKPGEFCDSCGKILPVQEGVDYYTILGYSGVVLCLDPSDMEKRFIELNKKFHPDRFASKSGLEVQLSHDWSSAVNNAYRTLKNPVSRAKYLVEKEFGSIEEKSAKVPVDMAESFFEVQDVMDTIRDADGNPPEASVREVRRAEDELRGKVKSLEAQLQEKFREYDANREKTVVSAIKEILSERSYIVSFLRQIDALLNQD